MKSFLTLLSAVFIILKLSGLIAWHWPIVLAPVFVLVVIGVIRLVRVLNDETYGEYKERVRNGK